MHILMALCVVLLSETERSCMQSREPCAEHHPASHVLEVRGAVVLGVVQGAELCRKPVSPTDGCYSAHNTAMCARPQARPSSSSPNDRALKPPCCRASSLQAVANHQAWLAYLSSATRSRWPTVPSGWHFKNGVCPKVSRKRPGCVWGAFRAGKMGPKVSEEMWLLWERPH
jgi:hypothetical protein